MIFWKIEFLARTSSLVSSRSSKCEHPCLIHVLRKKAFSLSTRYAVSCGFFIDAECQVKEGPFCSLFADCFFVSVFLIMKQCRIPSNAFPVSVEIITCFSMFYPVGMEYCIGLQMLNQPCILGIHLSWLWHGLFLYGAGFGLVEEFCICICRRYWSSVLFSRDVLVWFWHQANAWSPIRHERREQLGNLPVFWIRTAWC